MVLGSAIAAFSEVCPDRLDLLHPHYRKIAHLLPDIDEWGQVIVINTLLRYARTQFINPDAPVTPTTTGANGSAKPKKKNGDFDEDEEEEDEDDGFGLDVNSNVDPDLRILLDSCNPLMKSRNSAVILAVSSVYYYLAPQSEAQKMAKTIVRLVKTRKEISYVALANIATIAKARPSIFEPFLAEFFVLSTDPNYCKSLKLEIITLLATQDNINKILKELKSYVNSDDKTFAASAIQAIGRCAQSVPEITDRCLQGLMALLTNPSDTVVAESIVVIKKLLQRLVAPPSTSTSSDDGSSSNNNASSPSAEKSVEDEEEAKQNAEQQEATLKDVVTNLTLLLETIQNPKARESIVWVVGEYSNRLPKLAPDVLRQMAKSFTNEEVPVKLQVLNLGNKLLVTNPDQSKKLFEHILNLARYDTNYDVRDKARIIKKLLVSSGILAANAKKLVFVEKPVPTDVGPSEGRQRFALGTLSHLLNQTVSGYHPLPDWTTTPSSRSIRDEPIVDPIITESPSTTPKGSSSKTLNIDNFWEDEEEGEGMFIL
jgi:AP-3 complex subunit beta